MLDKKCAQSPSLATKWRTGGTFAKSELHVTRPIRAMCVIASADEARHPYIVVGSDVDRSRAD